MTDRAVTLLVVEDDHAVGTFLADNLTADGYDLLIAETARDGLRLIEHKTPDLVIVDIGLPDGSGLDLIARVRAADRRLSRADPDQRFLVLSGRAAEIDRVRAFERGADDYLVKPFSPGELVARVRAMLRRPRGVASSAQDILEEDAPLSFGELTVDPARREVRLLGEEVPLTALEFELLAALASRPGFVFSRNRLLKRVWGENYFGSDHVVDVHVANLRKKLKEDPSAPRDVQTVRGVGYRFRRP
jgi:DNA-binding response OmpR family regulator